MRGGGQPLTTCWRTGWPMMNSPDSGLPCSTAEQGKATLHRCYDGDIMTTSTEIRSGRAQRRAARVRSHHLVTADENSLLELETFLATLPLCASGRVFIEVPDARDIGVIEAPARMTVTWLARSSRTG